MAITPHYQIDRSNIKIGDVEDLFEAVVRGVEVNEAVVIVKDGMKREQTCYF